MSLHFALSASALDLGQLREELAAFQALGVEEIVVEVMDGAFAPAYGFGHRFIEAIASHGGGIACHALVMAHEPERRLEALVRAGAGIVTVHPEACTHAHRVLEHIRSLGAEPGLALRPTTPLTTLEYLLSGADRVVLLSAEPGCAPKAAGRAVLERVTLLCNTLNYRESPARIQVKTAADAYAAARADAAGAHGVIFEAGPGAGPVTPDALALLQRDMLARRRALDLA